MFDNKDPNHIQHTSGKPDFDVEVDGKHVSIIQPQRSAPLQAKDLADESFFSRLMNKQITRKELVILIVVIVLVISGAIYSAFYFTRAKPNTDKVTISKAKVVAPPAPKPIYSRLSGELVTQAEYNLPVTAVMIENTDDARPQSGLSQAGVVFEAVAEGGITRFVALFEEGQPSSIGPVRSARPYYIDWMLAFDASYVHAGGSPDALSYIPQEHVKDLNEFYNGGSFTRLSSRQAPHNLYTSMAKLLALETTKGYNVSNFTGFPRKVDQPAATPPAATINLNPSGPDFAVHYDYEKASNSYNRSEGGAVMIDANTNKQVSPKVVIAIVVPESQGALDASNAYYSDYQDIGSGKAYIFQDGNVTIGTWSKASPTAQILFNNAGGTPIPLNAGQTWVTAISSVGQINYN